MRLKNTIIFILSFFVVGGIIQYLFEQNIILADQSSGTYKINRIIKNVNINEIPIFGSSRAIGTFMPSVLGNNYFNYGIEGTKADVQLFFLNEECKKTKKNPYIIVVLELDGLKYAIGKLGNYIINSSYEPVKSLLGNNYHFWYGFPIFKYYGFYPTYFKDFLNSKVMLTRYRNKGCSIPTDKQVPEVFAKMVQERIDSVQTFESNDTLEKEYLDLFKKNSDRKFIIVIPPYHKSYFVHFSNYQQYINYADKLKPFKNITFLDYSHTVYPDEYFFNTTHLNYQGATLFNNMLKDTLDKITVVK